MPITEKERDQFIAILSKANEPAELMKLTAIVYDTVLHAKMPSSALMALGKLIFARTPWKDLLPEWQKLGGNPSSLNSNIRLPLLRAAEEHLLKELPTIFNIVAETVPEPDITEAAGEIETPPAAEAQTAVQEQLPLTDAKPAAPKENGHHAKGDKPEKKDKKESKGDPKPEPKPEPKAEPQVASTEPV